MNRPASILSLIILTIFTACSDHNNSPQKQSVDIQWGIAIRTIEAKQDTLSGESGVCIVNNALSYTLDSATEQALKSQQYSINDKQLDGTSVWVIHDRQLTRTPVTCGKNDSKRTLITDGLSGGEELVTSIHISPKK